MRMRLECVGDIHGEEEAVNDEAVLEDSAKYKYVGTYHNFGQRKAAWRPKIIVLILKREGFPLKITYSYHYVLNIFKIE
jgi:hypothetical protein